MTAIVIEVGGVLAGAACTWFACWMRKPEIDRIRLARDIAELQVVDLQAELAAEATIARTLRAELDGRPVSTASVEHRTITNFEYLRLLRKAEVYDAWAATAPGNTIHELTDPDCHDKASQPHVQLNPIGAD